MPRALAEKLDGEQRRILREAILAAYDDFDEIENTLRDYSVNVSMARVAMGPNLMTRTYSLIDVAFQDGLLIRLCDAICKARPDNAPVCEAITGVMAWLGEFAAQEESDTARMSVVISSVGTDDLWTKNFKEAGGFIKALKPCDVVDTLDRLKQSKDNVRGIMRDIEDADAVVAILSSRYTGFLQTASEFQHALNGLRRSVAGAALPRRRLLAVVLDPDSLAWLKLQLAEVDDLHRDAIVIAEFFDGAKRRTITGAAGAGQQAAELAKLLRGAFDTVQPFGLMGAAFAEEPAPAPAPLPEPDGPSADTIVILGEPKRAAPSAPEIQAATEALLQELQAHGVACDRWSDGWRESVRPLAFLDKRPLFVRMVADPQHTKAADLLGRLSSELNVSFGFQFDEEGEKVRAIADRPKVIWRPGGPDWTTQDNGPLLFSRSDRPADLAGWLAGLLGIALPASSNAIVCYEDPVDRGDLENPVRREAVETSLRNAIAMDRPPVSPDSVSFGYQQLQDVIDRVRDDRLTVIAAHDMRSVPGSEEDTLKRFRDIDRRIDESLARNHAERAPLMRVAVLLRNWKLFPALEFSRNSRVSKWQLLRIIKQKDGKFAPDGANVERLREHAAELLQRQSEHRAP